MARSRRGSGWLLAVACLTLAGCAAQQDSDASIAVSTQDVDTREDMGDPLHPRRPTMPVDANLTVHAGRAQRVPIKATGRELHVAVQWSGDSRVLVELVPPGDRPLSPDSDGVVHERGPTFENYHVTLPQRGTWSVRLTGVGVTTEGVGVRVSVHQDDATPRPSAPVLRQSVDGATVSLTVEAGPGEASAYLWEFGDGAVSRVGPAVSHTYREPGRYRVSVAVQINGRWRVSTAEEAVNVP